MRGGAWGIALLASHTVQAGGRDPGRLPWPTKVLPGIKGTRMEPVKEDVERIRGIHEAVCRGGLPLRKAAVEHMKD